MKIGIVGLSLSGKTTLFNALTGSDVDTAAFMGGKAEAHQAIVNVPDERVDRLNEIFQPKKKVPAIIDYIDLAGMSTDENKKQGFSDQFLGQVRTVDALCVVVRAFNNQNVPHPLDSIDPLRDYLSVEAEFILSDLAIIENRLERLDRQMRTKKTDQDVKEYALLERFREFLEAEKPLRSMDMTPAEEFLVRGYQFLTQKPVIIVLNIDDKDITNPHITNVFEQQKNHDQTCVIAISAQIEMEIQRLSDEEANIFRADLGITRPAMHELIRTSYDLLGLVSFFTVGEDEVRAWTIKRNTRAPQAAGAIHSDFERGFIRAEVVYYEEFIKRKSLSTCRSDGVLRLEGKDYIVQDGDIINFRFAV